LILRNNSSQTLSVCMCIEISFPGTHPSVVLGCLEKKVLHIGYIKQVKYIGWIRMVCLKEQREGANELPPNITSSTSILYGVTFLIRPSIFG
jgi:hypothetical protein